jgi:hypothetical protein
MFKLARLVIRIAFVMFAALLVLAFFTNPDEKAFEQKMIEEVHAEYADELSDPSRSWIGNLGTTFGEMAAQKMVTRNNYYICSVYTLDLPYGKYRFLGAFHLFFPLQSESPFVTQKS